MNNTQHQQHDDFEKLKFHQVKSSKELVRNIDVCINTDVRIVKSSSAIQQEIDVCKKEALDLLQNATRLKLPKSQYREKYLCLEARIEALQWTLY